VNVYGLCEIDERMESMEGAKRVLWDSLNVLIVNYRASFPAQGLWNEGCFTAAEVAKMLRRAGLANVKSRPIARRQLIPSEARKAMAEKEMT